MRITILLLMLLSSEMLMAQEVISGDASITGPYSGSEIVITTTSRLAGAIDSLTWGGKEFINSSDHGRQLQSASNFDAGSRFTGETFNPTEAGSRFDGAGQKSTSRLLHLIARGNRLQTTSQMAFWLRPGDKSGPNPAKNKTLLSNHLLTKRVTIGYKNLQNVIPYDVTFSLPIDETHKYAQFEAVTGYMPPEFSKFLTVDPATGQTNPLSDGPGEQRLPVILSTPSDSHAMGIYVPNLSNGRQANPGYGRWRFVAQKVVKWNCVFRIRDKNGVPAGDYTYRTFVVVGKLQDVVKSITTLHQEFGKK